MSINSSDFWQEIVATSHKIQAIYEELRNFTKEFYDSFSSQGESNVQHFLDDRQRLIDAIQKDKNYLEKQKDKIAKSLGLQKFKLSLLKEQLTENSLEDFNALQTEVNQIISEILEMDKKIATRLEMSKCGILQDLKRLKSFSKVGKAYSLMEQREARFIDKSY